LRSGDLGIEVFERNSPRSIDLIRLSRSASSIHHPIRTLTPSRRDLRQRQSQGWRTFLRNHADGIASIDLFVVPTISFRLRYGLLVLRHDRRRILWLNVTAHPSAEWIAQQVTEACGWESAPHYLIRDRDRVYGEAFTRRIRAMGIRDRPTAPRSP
jgi:hypothetical protein